MKKRTLKELFYFTAWERRGVLSLFVLIGLLAAVPYVYERILPAPAPLNDDLLSEAHAALAAKLTADSIARAEEYANRYAKANNERSMGDSPALRAGHTPTNSGLIQAKSVSPVRTPKAEEKPRLVIDVNTAMPEAWQQLSGIGETFSQRIVKYRDALGGFYSINQVATTFGLPPETFQSIKSQLTISGGVKQLGLNSATDAQLAAHPYISPKLASQIVNYRTKVQPITSDSIFLQLYFMDQTKLQQLKPYITYN